MTANFRHSQKELSPRVLGPEDVKDGGVTEGYVNRAP